MSVQESYVVFQNIPVVTTDVLTVDQFSPSGDLCLHKCKKGNEHGTISSVVSKHCHRCTTAVHTMDRSPPPPALCLSMCKEFTVHDTKSCVVFQNIVTIAVL